MLRLRKILLLDYLYYIIFILIILITIIRINTPKESIYNLNTKSIEGKIIDIKENDNRITLIIKNKEKVQVTYYKTKIKININLGDQIKVKGKFNKPKSQKTKNLFDYQKYLYYKNVYFIVTADEIILKNNNKNLFYFIKQKVIESFNKNAYLNTFIIGDKSYINDDVKLSYQENGISHLFAISGMHITLLANIIEKLLKKIKINENNIFKITSIILVLYLLLVGFSPSILRGVLFYILFKINNIYYFYIKPVNLFLLIISLSLLINPNYIFDVGFQYSYLISLALISLSKNIKSSNYFISLLKVSITSFIVSIPISLYNFYQINIMSIFYNLFFVPLISLLIFPFSLIVIFIKPLEPIYNFIILIEENLSLIISKIFLGKLIFCKVHFMVYIIYFIIVLIYIFRNKKEYLYLLLILLSIHYFYPKILKETYISYLDVGQGDSILIHKDNKNILIDTGGSLTTSGNISNNTIIPYLKSKGINKVDYLILTHGDADHMGESINIINKYKVEKIIFNNGKYNDLELKLINKLKDKNISYYQGIKNINLDDLKLSFLNTKISDDENDNSIVLYTKINNYKLLFMGDAGIEVESDLINKYNLENIDLLKIGHHGSKTSSSKEFIETTNPKYSIISVGENNKYNHPNKEVLKTLNNSKIYRTDKDGTITFKFVNNKLEIESYSK